MYPFILVVALAVNASAPPSAPIHRLMLDSKLCRGAVQLSNFGDQHKAQTSIEEEGPKAVVAAGNRADLRKAVKEFYAAAAAHCQSPSRSLENDLEKKEKELELELKLAGL